jgi:phosphoglycerol transferase
MKIALVNAFPNLAHSAEKEFIKRSILVFQKLGHEAIEVGTSDEIIGCDPTFVVVTHEFVAKTAQHYTVGFL